MATLVTQTVVRGVRSAILYMCLWIMTFFETFDIKRMMCFMAHKR